MQGLFITLEGGEGAGKSTQIPVMRGFYEKRGRQVLTLREPGGTPCAEEMRRILKTRRTDDELCDRAELLLMYAARAQLTHTVILPALEAGKVVICDRYDLSTVAYQGGGRGISAEIIDACRKAAIGSFRPDLTLLLDLEVEQGMQRARARGAADRFEASETAFFERVRRAYLESARRDPEHIRIIDASKNVGEVTAQILNVLEGLNA
ncbi:MAG: dTMP kinase [Succinivibrio sp.]|jgi:dTMP kinase|nr:dTMP kinase [Succinivibrio sp.]